MATLWPNLFPGSLLCEERIHSLNHCVFFKLLHGAVGMNVNGRCQKEVLLRGQVRQRGNAVKGLRQSHMGWVVLHWGTFWHRRNSQEWGWVGWPGKMEEEESSEVNSEGWLAFLWEEMAGAGGRPLEGPGHNTHVHGGNRQGHLRGRAGARARPSCWGSSRQ